MEFIVAFIIALLPIVIRAVSCASSAELSIAQFYSAVIHRFLLLAEKRSACLYSIKLSCIIEIHAVISPPSLYFLIDALNTLDVRVCFE